MQLSSLANCALMLINRVKEFDTLSTEDKFNLESALSEIRDLEYNLNNDSFGGVNKLKKMNLKVQKRFLHIRNRSTIKLKQLPNLRILH